MADEFKAIERSTAEAAARREILIVREALEQPEPGAALINALRLHVRWLHGLLGVDPLQIGLYVMWRLDVLRFGPMDDAAYLQDATENILNLLRRDESHA